MFEGNWKCSTCGGAITQLPFQPRSEAGLTCRDCYFKQKDGSGAAAGSDQPADDSAAVVSGGGEVDDRDIPPFDPDESFSSEPQADDGLEGSAVSAGEKPSFSGDWQCSGCGNPITSLPFQPRDTSNLKCLDCFKKSKA